MRSRAALVSLVAFGLAACGGGGSSPLTKAAWVSQANAICTNYENQVNARLDAIAGNTRGDLVKAIDVVLDLGRAQEGELQDLTPPNEDQDTVDAIFEQYDKTVDAAKDFRTTAAQGDQSEALGDTLPSDLQAKSDALDTAGSATDALFDSYGAASCGSEGSAA
jgi:hypothetical protein